LQWENNILFKRAKFKYDFLLHYFKSLIVKWQYLRSLIFFRHLFSYLSLISASKTTCSQYNLKIFKAQNLCNGYWMKFRLTIKGSAGHKNKLKFCLACSIAWEWILEVNSPIKFQKWQKSPFMYKNMKFFDNWFEKFLFEQDQIFLRRKKLKFQMKTLFLFVKEFLHTFGNPATFMATPQHLINASATASVSTPNPLTK